MTTLAKNQMPGMNYASLDEEILCSMDHTALISIIMELGAENVALQTENKAQHKEIITLKADKISLELDLQDSSNEIERLQLQGTSYRKTIQSLREDTAQFNQTVKELKNQIKEMEKEAAKKVSEENKAVKDLAELQKKYETLDTKFNGYKKDKKAEIKDLKKRLSKYEKMEAKYAKPKKDFNNSSMPSSKCIARNRVYNGRKPSGKKPGGQKGHKGHGRKDIPANRSLELIPECVKKNPDDWERVKGSQKTYKEVNLELIVDVLAYVTSKWRNKKTGEIVKAELPEGIFNEINYGPSVVALAAILHFYFGLSVVSTKQFIEFMTGGVVSLSTGYIQSILDKLTKKLKTMGTFSIIEELLLQSEYLGDDATGIMVNGKNKNIYNTCSPEASAFYYRNNKGLKGLEGRAITKYEGPCTHDHDISYYRLKVLHQECIEHILRALREVIEIETELKWPKKMFKHLQLLIHTFDHTGKAGEKRKGQKKQISPEAARKEYDDIIALAREEMGAGTKYADTVYHNEAWCLLNRLDVFKEATLRFLTVNVPATNNGPFYRQI